MAVTARKKGSKFTFSDAIDATIKSEQKAVADADKKSAPAKSAPKKTTAKNVTPVVVTEEAPAVVNEEPTKKVVTKEEKKQVCLSSYYTNEEARLIKAAAKKKNISITQYMHDCVIRDIEENKAAYEEVAAVLDLLESKLSEISG